MGKLHLFCISRWQEVESALPLLCGAVQGFGAPVPDLYPRDRSFTVWWQSVCLNGVSRLRIFCMCLPTTGKHCWTWTAQIRGLSVSWWEEITEKVSSGELSCWATRDEHHMQGITVKISLLEPSVESIYAVLLYFQTETLFPTSILLSRGAQSVQQKFKITEEKEEYFIQPILGRQLMQYWRQ